MRLLGVQSYSLLKLGGSMLNFSAKMSIIFDVCAANLINPADVKVKSNTLVTLDHDFNLVPFEADFSVVSVA